MDMAAAYAGVQAPTVAIDRDYNVEPLEGQGITAINSIFTSGLIDQQTALELLKRGEILGDDVEIDEILSRAENEQLKDIEMQVERTSAMAEIGEGTPEVEPE